MPSTPSLSRTLALVLVLGSSFAPAQGHCLGPTPITTGTTIGSNVNGSISFGGTCNGSLEVWYSYVAQCNGIVTVDTCGAATNFDTTLTAYEASCGCHNRIMLGCNDDTCGLRSQLSFAVVSGVTYLISVGGYNGATGTFALAVSPCVTGIPPNDSCSAAIAVPVGRRVLGHNIGATTGGLPAACPVSGSNVWYSVTSPQTMTLTATTCNAAVGGFTTLDTVLHVIVNGCAFPASLGCNDQDCGNQSSVTWSATGGVTYYVSVGGYFGGIGTFGLEISTANQLELTFPSDGLGTSGWNVGFRISGTAPYYYFFVSLIAGTFPNGWFYGVDITMADLTAQLNGGSPFNGPLNSCGTFGPWNLPHGLVLYAVALGAPTAGGLPTVNSPPVSFTVP
jgi:hypothetical protein